MKISQGYRRHFDVAVTALQTWLKLDRQSDQEMALFLVKNIGQLKGPLQKVAQLTAMLPDVLPPAIGNILQELCMHAPAMEWSFVRRRLIAELGPRWQDSFETFEQHASFSASLGQVHKASLFDGTKVACKIQYPGMDNVLKTDFTHIEWLCRFYERFGKALDTQLFQNELKERLWEEIDYLREGAHLRWFAHFFRNEPSICVPTPISALSTKRVLTMSWLEGHPLTETSDLRQDHRDRLGELIFKAWFHPFCQAGVLHGDPHIGNMSWTTDHLNLLDFGCVRIFSPSFIQNFFKLYKGMLHENQEEQIEAYAQWGFHPLTKEVLGALTTWSSFLLKPFLTQKHCTLDELSSPQEGSKIALSLHQIFAEQGGVTVPQEFLIFDRVAVIVGSALMRIKARASWQQLLHNAIDLFSLEECLSHQAHFFNQTQKSSFQEHP